MPNYKLSFYKRMDNRKPDSYIEVEMSRAQLNHLCEELPNNYIIYGDEATNADVHLVDIVLSDISIDTIRKNLLSVRVYNSARAKNILLKVKNFKYFVI